jgi:hypothetical protein
MITDAIDSLGRRYLEVDIFPDGKLKQVFRDSRPEECAECGALVHHGWQRYFQRNDPTDGSLPLDIQSILMGLTYDTVCGSCGDRLLRKDSL